MFYVYLKYKFTVSNGDDDQLIIAKLVDVENSCQKKWTSVIGVIIFCVDFNNEHKLKKTRIESELHTNYSKILSQDTLLQKQEAGMNLVSDHEPCCNVSDHVPCCTMFDAALKEFLVQPRIFIHQLSVQNCYKHKAKGKR